MRAKAIAVVLTVLLGGCVWRSELPKPLAFGPPPANVEQAAAVYFSQHLRRADTLQYRFSEPYRAYRYKPILDGSGVDWKGWAVDAEVHVRDENGALAGWHTWRLQFAGNVVVDSQLAEGAETLWRRYDPEVDDSMY